MLLKEYCAAAFRICVLVRDYNWHGRDPGSGKNDLAALESCLLVMLSLVGDQWENVEYIKTFLAALVTWLHWHSRTPGGVHKEEYGEAMLSRLCAQCRSWTTITSLSGTSENFETLSHTLIGRKNLRSSLTEKCVMQYGSNLRNFVLGVSVTSLPNVQWKPPPLWVVEAVVLGTGDALRFPGTFAVVPPRSFLFSVFHKYIRPLLRKTPPRDDLLILLQQTVPPAMTAGQRNVDIQTVMQITRAPKPEPKPKPKPGKPVAKSAPPPPPKTRCTHRKTCPQESKTGSQTLPTATSSAK